MILLYRVRRDPHAKFAEEEEKKLKTLHAASAPKALTKNPLRYVVDAPGFCPLDKNDARLDLKEVSEKTFEFPPPLVLFAFTLKLLYTQPLRDFTIQ